MKASLAHEHRSINYLMFAHLQLASHVVVRREKAIDVLRRIDSGEDDRFDFSVSAELHASRR
jgi:hypothetical protein